MISTQRCSQRVTFVLQAFSKRGKRILGIGPNPVSSCSTRKPSANILRSSGFSKENLCEKDGLLGTWALKHISTDHAVKFHSKIGNQCISPTMAMPRLYSNHIGCFILDQLRFADILPGQPYMEETITKA